MKYSIISVVIFLVTVMSVHFSTNETRTSGTILNGVEIEVGGTNWEANVNAIYVGQDQTAWSSMENINYMQCTVPLPELSNVDILEWKIDARVRGTQADGGVPKSWLVLGDV